MIAQAFRQLLILLALALAPATVSGLIQLKWNSPPTGGDEMPLSAVQALGEKVLWVDARPRAKFDAGHIPNAVLLNEDEWDRLVPAFLDAWEPEKAVVVYCDGGSCDASHAVAKRLKEELKLENIRVLKGGWGRMAAKVILLLLRLAVGGVFIYAGAMKAWDTQDFASDIRHYAIITNFDTIILLAVYLPWVELFAGLAVVFRRLYLGGLIAIAGLMLIFTGALTSAWARGLDISCGCFGKEKEAIRTNFPKMMARDLGILAGVVVLLGVETRRRKTTPL